MTKKNPPIPTVNNSGSEWPFPTGTRPGKTAKPKTLQAKAIKRATNSVAEATPTTAVHKVMATLSNVELVKAKSALSLDLFANSLKLGTLDIGQGSVFWTGKGRQKSKRIPWPKFAAMMNKIAYNE